MEDESARWADLKAEMSQPDSDPVVANIEAGRASAEPQPAREPTPTERADQYIDDPSSVDDLPYSRRADPEPEPQPQPRYSRETVPDVDTDPIGHFEARMRAMERAAGVQRPPTEQDRARYVATGGGAFPDVNENPIEHFQARNDLVVNAVHNDRFVNMIKESERRAEYELGDDYGQATDYLKAHRLNELAHMYPDHPQVHAYARQHGYPSAGHMRQALMMQDAATIARLAFEGGRDPAQDYYGYAMQRGYRPQTAITRSMRRDLVNVAENAPDEVFDRYWDQYATHSKRWDEGQKQARAARRR
jgi:hypothetical protein